MCADMSTHLCHPRKQYRELSQPHKDPSTSSYPSNSHSLSPTILHPVSRPPPHPTPGVTLAFFSKSQIWNQAAQGFGIGSLTVARTSPRDTPRVAALCSELVPLQGPFMGRLPTLSCQSPVSHSARALCPPLPLSRTAFWSCAPTVYTHPLLRDDGCDVLT